MVILSVFAGLAITGCSSSAPLFKKNDQLGPEEGALALINHSPINNVVLVFRKKGALGAVVESGTFSPGVQFRLVRMPAGEYEVDAIVASGMRFDYSGLHFIIKPGVINYVGDSFIDVTSRPGYIWARFVDTQDRFDNYFAQRFPDIAKRYKVEMAVKNTDN